MNLCICGRFQIEQLEKWVTEKFSPVENKNVVVPSLSEPPSYPATHLGKLIKYVPVKDKDVLTLHFVLDYVEKDHKTQPLKYFAHLIGNEGENSLLSYLKAQGLALAPAKGATMCDVEHLLDCMTFLQVEIILTAKGLDNYELVLEAAFQYFQRLRDAGPQE